MRPGLVGAGVVLVALAGLLVAGIYATPSGGSQQTSRTISIALPSGGNASVYLWAENGTRASVAVAWHSTVGVNAWIAPANGCGPDPRTCRGHDAAANWSTAMGGAWSTGADPGAWWVLRFADVGGGRAMVVVDATVSSASAGAPPLWTLMVQFAAATMLGAVGAVALFLGLFLRGGVYRRRPADGPPPAGH